MFEPTVTNFIFGHKCDLPKALTLSKGEHTSWNYDICNVIKKPPNSISFP